jgi:hypothetical protein
VTRSAEQPVGAAESEEAVVSTEAEEHIRPLVACEDVGERRPEQLLEPQQRVCAGAAPVARPSSRLAATLPGASAYEERSRLPAPPSIASSPGPPSRMSTSPAPASRSSPVRKSACAEPSRSSKPLNRVRAVAGRRVERRVDADQPKSPVRTSSKGEPRRFSIETTTSLRPSPVHTFALDPDGRAGDRERVLAAASAEPVLPAAALDHVVAAEADDHVAPRRAEQHVVAGRAHDGRRNEQAARLGRCRASCREHERDEGEREGKGAGRHDNLQVVDTAAGSRRALTRR